METVFIRKILLPIVMFVGLVLVGVILFALFQELISAF